MKIKNCMIGAVFAAIFTLLNCFAGTFIVENDYEEIFVASGGFISRSKHLNARQYNTDSPTFLNYNPEKDDPLVSILNDFFGKQSTTSLVKLNDFFAKRPGAYTVSKKIDGKTLKIDFQIDRTFCVPGTVCMMEEENIQDFYCKVLFVTLDGIELSKRSKAKNNL